jgi:glycosyltransferase involved in cell wall biosynthesis
MKFSLIVPACREAGYLRRALLAIKRQNYEDYEVIAVVPPFKDETERVAKEYADVVVFDEGAGPGVARNLGAVVSTGDVLIFLDADVVIPPDFLRSLNKVFSRSKPKLVIPKLYVYDGDVRGGLLHAALSLFNRVTGFSCGSITVIRRDAFFKLGGFKPIFGEDTELSLRARKALRRGEATRQPRLVAYTSSRRVRRAGLVKLLTFWVLYNMRLFLLGRTLTWQEARYDELPIKLLLSSR